MNEQEKNTATGVLDDATNTSTPTDVNSTYQTTTVNDTGDTVIKDAYANKDKSGYASAPNTKIDAVDSKTGSGLKAAEGTDYSWNTKADERAELDYKSSVLESKSNMLENRQNIESQGQQAQDQFAMKQYTQNQSIDKVGWTGGYVLDSERQVNYLKQTIQAQMYGQMELQKYGYDTSLAAARLAYDTNRYDLALEYYNTALSRAVSEAEITGYYVSPETNEMLDQYSMASRTLNDKNAPEEERQRADRILSSVYEWFKGHGISEQGVETYNHIVQERTNKMSVEQTLKYIDTANKQIDSNTFTKLDENGNPSMSKDGTSMETINFNTVSKDDLLDYIGSSEMAKKQYYGYLDTKIKGETKTQFETWLISKGLMDKQEDGTYTPKSNIDYSSQLYQFLKSSDIYQSLVDSFKDIDGDKAKQLQNIYENWDFEIALPDGSSMIKTFNELENEITSAKNLTTSGSLKDLVNKDTNNNYTSDVPDPKEINIKGNDFKATHYNDANLIVTDITADVKTNFFKSGAKEQDITLSKLKDAYNLELAESVNSPSLGTDDQRRLEEIAKRSGNLQQGSIIVYNDTPYVYINNPNDNNNIKGTAFVKLKGQCGKSGATDLVNDIKSAVGA